MTNNMNEKWLQLPAALYGLLGKHPALRSWVLQFLFLEAFLGLRKFVAALERRDEAALAAFMAAGPLARPSSWAVAQEIAIRMGRKFDHQACALVADCDPKGSLLTAFEAVKTSAERRALREFSTLVQTSPAWTKGFRPPWGAIVAVARLARLLTWGGTAAAPEEAAAPAVASEPTAAPAAVEGALPPHFVRAPGGARSAGHFRPRRIVTAAPAAVTDEEAAAPAAAPAAEPSAAPAAEVEVAAPAATSSETVAAPAATVSRPWWRRLLGR